MADAPYTLPDLAYDYAALDALAHARASDDFSAITKLQKDLAFHVSGHVLHSMFWTNLSPDGGGKPEGALGERIDRDFGGFDRFQAHMNEAASTVQGSGWAIATWEPTAGRILVQQVYDHQGNHGQGSVPLLAFDAWEHAYYLQYKNVKADFFEALWNVVNWNDVAQRLTEAQD